MIELICQINKTCYHTSLQNDETCHTYVKRHEIFAVLIFLTDTSRPFVALFLSSRLLESKSTMIAAERYKAVCYVIVGIFIYNVCV